MKEEKYVIENNEEKKELKKISGKHERKTFKKI